MYNETITIINVLNVKGIITYFPTVLIGVHYQDKQGVRTGTTVQFTDNQGYVQIPQEVIGYKPIEEWKALTDKSTHWTLQENDFIVKGSNYNQVDIKKTPGLRTIDSVENIDYGIIIEPHFGVTLK